MNKIITYFLVLLHIMLPLCASEPGEHIKDVLYSVISERGQMLIERLIRDDYAGPQLRSLLLYSNNRTDNVAVGRMIAAVMNRECKVVHVQMCSEQDFFNLAQELQLCTAPQVIVLNEITLIKNTNAVYTALATIFDTCENNPYLTLVVTTSFYDDLPAIFKDRFVTAALEIVTPEAHQRRKLITSLLPVDHGCSYQDIEYLVAKTEGFSSKKITMIVEEALALAADANEFLAMKHFMNSIKYHGGVDAGCSLYPLFVTTINSCKQVAHYTVKYIAPLVLGVAALWKWNEVACQQQKNFEEEQKLKRELAEKRDALLNKNNEIAINQHKDLMKFNRLKLAINNEFKKQKLLHDTLLRTLRMKKDAGWFKIDAAILQTTADLQKFILQQEEKNFYIRFSHLTSELGLQEFENNDKGTSNAKTK